MRSVSLGTPEGCGRRGERDAAAEILSPDQQWAIGRCDGKRFPNGGRPRRTARPLKGSKSGAK